MVEVLIRKAFPEPRGGNATVTWMLLATLIFYLIGAVLLLLFSLIPPLNTGKEFFI